MAACTRAPVAGQPRPITLSVRIVASAASPSPLVEVRVGHVRAVVPRSWHAEMLPVSHFAQEGFVASPRINAWLHGQGGVPGLEAFWVDGDQLPIPSDYYYLAARNSSFGELTESRPCGPGRQQVFANHPPDLTGAGFSPGDYVVGANGVCLRDGRPTHWAYVVAAPGFGPARGVGIPNSGLYVVLVRVSGPRSAQLLKEMMASARFGDTTIEQIVAAAGGPAGSGGSLS